ncbi:hypothetical protein [Eisenbergiella tayi]|uniref:hypothetical protein n=1 Tax=Eisenbergiella tayi TaxID=1432052 RepID=UPI00207F1E9A|nr:hypothetical protein CE91St58_02370 [Lachnospiraceae bacterium]
MAAVRAAAMNILRAAEEDILQAADFLQVAAVGIRHYSSHYTEAVCYKETGRAAGPPPTYGFHARKMTYSPKRNRKNSCCSLTLCCSLTIYGCFLLPTGRFRLMTNGCCSLMNIGSPMKNRCFLKPDGCSPMRNCCRKIYVSFSLR